MNPVAIRLLNQQLIAPQFDTPAEVVRYMGAMQAQEYRMMRRAVAMRTRKPSYNAFKKAFDEGEIIRLHLMRGTWQLVSAEDYWMLIDLCAPKALAAIKSWMRSNRISISEDEEKKYPQDNLSSCQRQGKCNERGHRAVIGKERYSDG